MSYTRVLKSCSAAWLLLAACNPEVTNPPQEAAGTVSPDFLTTGGGWIKRASLPSARWGHKAAVVANSSGHTILYVFGGWPGNGMGGELNRVDAFNPSTGKWSARAPMPDRRRESNGAAVLNGKVYTTGGHDEQGRYTRTLLIYNTATNTWVRSPDSLPNAVVNGLMATMGGKVYVLYGDCLSGCTSSGNNLVYELYSYDPSSHTWTKRKNVPHTHVGAAGGVINGRWYVAGGGNVRYGQRWLDVYDPATNTWTTRASMQYAEIFATGAVLGGKLYVFGEHHTQVYDPATNTWSTRATMPEPRRRTAGGTVFRGGKFVAMVTGGTGPGPTFATARVDEYSE